MENKSPRKYHPGGPTYCFNGKTIVFLTFCLESGGVIAEILIDILKCFDWQEIFPQIHGGSIPFLLIDGHNTWLDSIIIDYNNDIENWWKVCFSVPYATLLWHMGDLAEQKRNFRSELY